VPCNEQLIIRHEHSLPLEQSNNEPLYYPVKQFVPQRFPPSLNSKVIEPNTANGKWKIEILAAARLAPTDEYGLMLFALSVAQIVALPNPAGPGGQGPCVFVPAANPGPPQPDASVAAMQAWKILDDRYAMQRSALNLLTSEV
jgi:hypothetical protein